MLKTIVGIAAGGAVWILFSIIAGVIVRFTWPAYTAVADSMAFTLPMMWMRLAIGAVALLLAAGAAATIAPKPNLAALLLGILLLIVFIPVHINLWDKFPVWYHLTFLLTLIPLSLLGGQLRFKKTRPPSS